MSERDWVGELSSYLEESLARICERTGQPPSIAELRVNPPLAVEEAKFFLLGMEAALFRPDAEGYLQSELLPASSRGGEIFSVRALPPFLVRERICQFATASALVLERGWQSKQIKIEPDHAAPYGVDLVIESDSGKILICVEIKRSVHELQKFASDFRQCCRRGAHAKADCAFQQNHGVFEFCARSQPKYLWIVAPGADVCFELGYAPAMIEVKELGALPPRSHIEFGLESSRA